jgi:DNA polymerase-1
LREEAERQAFNHLVQGTAQEVMKLGMLRVEAEAPAGYVYPLLQIYDEMIYEVPERESGAATAALPGMMATSMSGVAIVAKASVARTWGALK